jgi:hypothetical protein
MSNPYEQPKPGRAIHEGEDPFNLQAYQEESLENAARSFGEAKARIQTACEIVHMRLENADPLKGEYVNLFDLEGCVVDMFEAITNLSQAMSQIIRFKALVDFANKRTKGGK